MATGLVRLDDRFAPKKNGGFMGWKWDEQVMTLLVPKKTLLSWFRSWWSVWPMVTTMNAEVYKPTSGGTTWGFMAIRPPKKETIKLYCGWLRNLAVGRWQTCKHPMIPCNLQCFTDTNSYYLLQDFLKTIFNRHHPGAGQRVLDLARSGAKKGSSTQGLSVAPGKKWCENLVLKKNTIE